MENLNCDIVKDLLPLYHDKAVSEVTEKAVKAHLDGCESCREEYKKLDESLIKPVKSKKTSLFLKRIMKKGVIAGVLISLLVVAVLGATGMYLTMNTVIPMSEEQYKIYGVYRYNGYNVVISELYVNHVNLITDKEETEKFSLKYIRPIIYTECDPEKQIPMIFCYPYEGGDDEKGVYINGVLYEFIEEVPEYAKIKVDNLKAGTADYFMSINKEAVTLYETGKYGEEMKIWKSWTLDGKVLYDGTNTESGK